MHYHVHRSYGLNIHSALPLPELPSGEGRADVFIRPGQVSSAPPPAAEAERCLHASSERAVLFWEEAGFFEVNDGREIMFQAAPAASDYILRIYLLGSLWGILLHQRGLLVLHASVVSRDGQAMAFLGHKGAGKSTTAAILHQRGFQILSDDLLVLDFQTPEHPRVIPGIPEVKLWPDSVQSLGLMAEDLPRLRPELSKRVLQSGRVGEAEAPVLRSVVLLDAGPAVALERLTPLCSCKELIAHSYALRFLGQSGINRAHFQHCSQLAASLPVYRLTRPTQLDQLSEVARLLDQHLP